MRLLYCRHTGCGETYESVAGRLAPICPSCLRPARWSTIPDAVNVRPHDKGPRVPFDLNLMDRKLLRAARIAQA